MIRVMIVEDDFMVADINRDMTERMKGFSVVKIASSGTEAIEYLEANPVDLVILDVYLPDIRGVEVLKTARKREYPVDFILVTAAHDASTVEESLRYGVVDYLIKPFEMDRYLEALSNFAKRRSSLSGDALLDQTSLDEARGSQSSGRSAERFPKGIAKPTLAKIEAALPSMKDGFGVAALAERLGLSRLTAHRYLEYLADTGLLKKEFEYQKIGRPAVLYRRT